MSKYFNDSPIETAEDDQYGISPFSKALAISLLGIVNPIGTVIAINGAWGSGKSSAVNLIRAELDSHKDESYASSISNAGGIGGRRLSPSRFCRSCTAL